MGGCREFRSARFILRLTSLPPSRPPSLPPYLGTRGRGSRGQAAVEVHVLDQLSQPAEERGRKMEKGREGGGGGHDSHVVVFDSSPPSLPPSLPSLGYLLLRLPLLGFLLQGSQQLSLTRLPPLQLLWYVMRVKVKVKICWSPFLPPSLPPSLPACLQPRRLCV